MRVTLSMAELAFADEVGLMRYRVSRLKGWHHAYGATDTPDSDIAGARAEQAFRLMIGAELTSWVILETGGHPSRTLGDIAGYQIRSTCRRELAVSGG